MLGYFNAPGNGSKKVGTVLAAVLIASVLTSACDEAPKTEEYLSRAQQYRDAGDLRASIIEAKNVLRADSDNQEARLLLGLNYFDLGDWLAAEAMLEKAIAAKGALEYAIRTPLGRTKIILAKYDQVLQIAQTAGDMNESLQAEILSVRGQAYHGKELLDQARQSFDAAVRIDPKFHGGYLGQSGLALLSGKYPLARQLLDKAISLNSDGVEVLEFQGSFELERKNFDQAIVAFKKLNKVRPERIDYLIGQARAEIGKGAYKDASKTLDKALARSPQAILAHHYQSIVSYALKDYQSSLTHAEAVLSASGANAESQVIAGAASYAVGNYEGAYARLKSVLENKPDSVIARRLLGATQMKLGRSGEALSTLKPLAEQADVSATVLELIGQAALRSNQQESGTSYLERAILKAPQNSRTRTMLGSSQVARGNWDQGIRELQSAVELEPNSSHAEVLLIYSLIRSERFKEAVEAARKFQEKEPKNSIGYTLEGGAHLGLKDDDSARAAFEKAFTLEPGRTDAGNNLASLAAKKFDFDKAASYLREIMRRNPGHMPTMVRLWQLEEYRGKSAEVEHLLADNVEKNGNAVVPRLLLARYLLSTNRPLKAINAATPALDTSPSHTGLLEIVGQAYLTTRRYDAAVNSLNQLVELQPKSASARFLLARAHGAFGQTDDAIYSLEAVLSLDEKHLNARLAYARLLNTKKRHDEVDQQIAKLHQIHPKSDLVGILVGDVMLSRGKDQEALQAYRNLAAKPDAAVTSKIAQAHWNAGKKSMAIDILETWLKSNPKDLRTRFVLGTYFVKANRDNDAQREFEKIIEANPKNWLPQNEIAWMLYESGEFDRALPFAKRARELAPDSPITADTLGMILLAKGQSEKALALLRGAAKKLSKNPDVLFHLAQALSKNGQRIEALKVLTDALALNSAFDSKKEALVLLNKLEEGG